ncbi:murein biosynthesis integral membrane protein MurJ [Clostridium tepidum]|jgi:putative peptidoglycan lipid II flippase|uniref:Probable lipid II flippase MurJ n=1 Tax=Clostridium tepidum TaxID=1962263 RepID=A0A1S9I3A2_9CLOT|nr:murein biosynthesis integral membrane protein MurJ [Clostridium tepidum]MCR1935242.1 murein biosynthesis integral membrane protein MurJ [Clostridium tepidum]MDU6878638.1 murein biosynthesis integral membrane protein MurJ [Clostridium botulinum]OOO61928.1 murein biosynthesis integral membrane protein MurJ [Clostridium tepidum]OOO64735.1 murein biosynthesis integral membrane protein MurJ [Clostridium tepidum]
MKKNKALKSSVFVMLLIILGKVFALIRDSLIAAKFGATNITDIYTFSVGIVSLLTTISYGLTTTFIPIHTENLESGNKKESNKFVNNVLNTFSIGTIILTILMIIFAKYIIYIFGPGFHKDLIIFNMSIKITRIMLLSLIFISLQSVITGVLQSHKQFLEPAAMAMVSNIIHIIYLVFLASNYGMVGFAIAIVLGFFAQFIINIPKYKKMGYKYSTYIDLEDSKTRQMFKLTMPVIISTSVIQLSSVINRAFATTIFGGAATILDNANKINTLAYEVFAIGIAMIVYPTLSELAAKNDKKQYKVELGRAINIILVIMVPAAVGIAILREPLINIIFKRGAFSNEAAYLTSQALLLFTPAMIAYGVRDILNKAFYAIKDTKTPMINSFIGIIINIVINVLLIKYLGVSGLTLATSISAIIITIIMLLDLNKKLNGIDIKNIIISFLKVILSALIMGIIVTFVNKLILLNLGTGTKGSVISVLICMVVGATCYAIVIYLLKVEEIQDIVEPVLKMLKLKK